MSAGTRRGRFMVETSLVVAALALALLAMTTAAGAAPFPTGSPSPAPTAACLPPDGRAGADASPLPDPDEYLPTVSPVPGFPVAVELPGLREVPLDPGMDIQEWASWGPVAVYSDYDGEPAGPPALYAVDLAAGAWRVVVLARRGWDVGAVDISETHLAWAEYRYLRARDGRHDIRWRILAAQRDDERPFEVAHGTGRAQPGGDYAQYPELHLDGERIAWIEQAPTRADPLRWRIVVADLASGERLASVATRRWLYQFDLAGDHVAWSEGRIDADGTFYDMALYVQAIPDGRPRRIAAGSYDVLLSGRDLVWSGDPSDAFLGRARRTWTLPLGDLAADPVDLSPVEPAGTDAGSFYPGLGDDLVAWTDLRGALVRLLLVRDLRSSLGAVLSRSGLVYQVAAGGGWLTWVKNDRYVGTLELENIAQGLPLTDLRSVLAPACPSPTVLSVPTAGPSSPSPAPSPA